MTARTTKPRCAYTLVEAVIAISLLAIAIAGATMLARTILIQREASNQTARMLNAQEQSARLFQLGLSSTTITNILPETCVSGSPANPKEISLSFSIATANVTVSIGAGSVNATLEQATNTAIFATTTDTSGSTAMRTNHILMVRPSIR